MKDFIKIKLVLLTSRDYKWDNRWVKDKLNKISYIAISDFMKKIQNRRRIFCILIPVLENVDSFFIKSLATGQEMLNCSRNVESRAEEAVSLLVTGGPMSGVPVRVISTTE